MKRTFQKLSVFFLLCQSFSTQASTIYVDINNPGGDGSSWAMAFNNLQTALDSAVNGDQLWVAQGTYVPSQGYNVLTGSTSLSANTQTFKIPSGVEVYGGFNGTETTLSQRNFKTNLTILSGNLGAGNNAYHVVFFFRVGAGTQLDGFTITEGMAIAATPNATGGGIYNNGSGNNNISNPTIKNCNVINNSAVNGAGIYNNGTNSGNSSPSVTNSVFSNNVSTNQGGAVFNAATATGNSSPSFTNCLFATNQATQGGAVHNNGTSGNSSPSFMNTTFFNNSANVGRILTAIGNGDTSVTNAILWDTITSTSLISLASGATASINYSDITGSWPGTGNIDADPLFTDESNLIGPDLIWATNDDGLTLQPSSPALATGTSSGAPTTDLIGNPQTSPASMGCYTQVFIPSTVSGYGTIAGGIIFKVKAAFNAKGQVVADMFYNDPGTRVHFDNPVVTSLIFSGSQATLSGTTRVQNQNVTFTAIFTSGTPGVFSLSLSNGYSVSGNLTSGGVLVQ